MPGTSFQSESDAPPWPLIHFDVRCARRGHDLRGQSDPTCPACKLEFTWSQAAPLEQLTCANCNYHLYGLSDSRCPECGTTVDWNEALLRYRRREKPLFEYRWRDRPIRSFFHTWRLALRPKKLWQTVDIYDPPQIRPLIIVAIIWLAITAISVPFWVGIHMTIRGIQLYGPMQWSFVLDYFIDNLMTAVVTSALWRMTFSLAVWCLFAFGALLVFQQSMRRYKVRTGHVLRVCAYGMAPLLPIFVFLGVILDLILQLIGSFRLGGLSKLILLIFMYLLVVWTVRQAYRHYIRMPHSLGVAIASQVIAIIATAAIPSALFRLLRSGG